MRNGSVVQEGCATRAKKHTRTRTRANALAHMHRHTQTQSHTGPTHVHTQSDEDLTSYFEECNLCFFFFDFCSTEGGSACTNPWCNPVAMVHTTVEWSSVNPWLSAYLCMPTTKADTPNPSLEISQQTMLS
jgi:hypothetical protein